MICSGKSLSPIGKGHKRTLIKDQESVFTGIDIDVIGRRVKCPMEGGKDGVYWCEKMVHWWEKMVCWWEEGVTQGRDFWETQECRMDCGEATSRAKDRQNSLHGVYIYI